MEQFLRSLVEEYKYKALDSTEYVNYMKSYLLKTDTDALKKLEATVKWDDWFESTDLPEYYKPSFRSDLESEVTLLVSQWSGNLPSPSNPINIESLLPLQVEAFLDEIIRKAPLSTHVIDKMLACYKFQNWKNYEIKYRWLLLCVKSKYVPQLENCLDFVQNVGRMKYLKPIYSALAEWPEAKEKAIETYKQNIKYMHSVTATVIGRILKV
ncbi:hypothetical protein GJ496_008201 [Pomphorhynchus laevis]|nr:hypothetical protein GJ496_008201 [Pomphorhynchus laevis]